MLRVRILVPVALLVAGAVWGTVPAGNESERADVVRPVPFARAFTVAGATNATVGTFAVPPESDLRPWRVRYSFRYRTAGFAGEGLRLVTQAVFDGGARFDNLTPTVRNLNWDAGTTYRCGASEDWKKVDLDVDFKNALPPEVRVVCEGLVATGCVEFADFAVALVLKPRHRLTGGEFPLEGGNVLKHVFFAETGTVHVALADPAHVVRAAVRVRDAEGQPVGETRALAAVDAVTLAGRGFYTLEVAACYADGTKVTTTGSAAVLGPRLTAAQTAGSRFGAMIVNGGAGAFTRALGSRWDWRFFFHGRDNAAFVGPQFGDGAIYAGHQSPIYPEAMDPAHVGKGGMWPAKDWDVQRALTRAFLEKNPCFAGRRLCLVNEPDFKWRGTIAEMVRAHRVFAEEVHRLYPTCEVQGPACSRVKPEYLRALGQEGFFDCIDAVNIHAYVDGTKPEGAFRTKLREGMDVIRREFACAKPVYVTEFGWTTENGTWQEPVSEFTQARYLTRACTFIAAEDIRAAVWFCDFYVARNYGEGGFSMLRLGNDCISPKPAVAAFATLARNLSSVQGRMRAQMIGPEMWLATGRRADGSAVTLVWTRTGVREIPLPVRTVRAESFLGTPVALGNTTLRVSESPVYLFGDETFSGPAWVAPPVDEAKPVVVAPDEYPLGLTGTGWKCRDNLQTPVLPDRCWTGDAAALLPKVRVAYSSEGLIFNVDVYDTKHEQPYAQERLIEGDAVTVAVDIDRGLDWQPNAHITSYKGHRAFEYTVALRDDGKREAWRRNAWDFDIRSNAPVVVFNGVTRVGADKTRYMIWLTWPRLGMDGPPPPGTKFGIAVSVSDLTGGKRKTYDLFGGITGTPDPTKYGTFVCVEKKCWVKNGNNQ